MDFFNLIALKGKISNSSWISSRPDCTQTVNFSIDVHNDKEEPLTLDVYITNPEIVDHIVRNQKEIRTHSIVGIKGELKKLKNKKGVDYSIEYRVVVSSNDQHKFVYIEEKNE